MFNLVSLRIVSVVQSVWICLSILEVNYLVLACRRPSQVGIRIHIVRVTWKTSHRCGGHYLNWMTILDVEFLIYSEYTLLLSYGSLIVEIVSFECISFVSSLVSHEFKWL